MDRLRLNAIRLILAISACSGAAVIMAPAPAYAQDAELKKLLDSARENYDILEIDAARDKIEQALKAAKKGNVTAGLLLADIYIMQGIVEYGASGDEDAVSESFISAVKADREAKVPKNYSTPDLERILADARDKVGADTPDRPASGSGISHAPLTDVDASKPVIFETFVPADMPVYKMFVYFRVFGDENWKKVELQPTSAERFAVQVAGKEFSASQFDYYIVAEDRGGTTVGNSGAQDSPHNVVVLGSGGKDVDPDPDPDPEKPKTPRDSIMYVGVKFGTSPGILTGAENNQPTAHPERDVSAGLAMAFGHAELDIGATLTPKMHLGLFFRFQFAPAQPFEGLPTSTTTGGSGFWDTQKACLGLGLPGDCILGLKYKLQINDSDKVKVYTTMGTGVGRVRNWLRLKQSLDTPTGRSLCEGKPTQTGTTTSGESVDFCYIRDTVRTGWFHVGAGGGLAIGINDFTDLVLDTYLMILAPVTSVNLDLNGGFVFTF